MEKRALLAFVLSMAVFIVWSFFFGQKATPPPQSQKEKAVTEQAEVKEQSGGVKTIDGKDDEKAVEPDSEEQEVLASAKDIIVETNMYRAVFSERGGRLKSLTLNKYRTDRDENSPPLELVVVDNRKDKPLGLSFKSDNGTSLSNKFFKSDQDNIVLVNEGETANLNMTYTGKDGLVIVRTFRFTADSYLIELEDKLRNFSEKTIDDNLVITLKSNPITRKERYAGFGAWIDEELFEVKPQDLDEDLEKIKGKKYNISWAGYEDQYFLAAILPAEKEKTRINAEKYGEKGVSIQFINAPLVMPPKTEKIYKYTVFYGPKDYNTLKKMDNELKRSIYFGWFDILSKPLLIMMTWLYQFVGNYGIVIIIVTLIIKILFWPLTAKSYKSMKGMQKLQPKIMKLREKYKDDREAMNREMMQLYRAYKVNPLGGCLPMVIQIPVFIALYRLLDYSLELRHAPFWLWINDLAAPDRLFHFGFSIPLMEPPSGIPVLTLLMGASMLLQQKMTPTPGDPTQAKMMMLMPVFFTFIFINFPSGLVLYWLVNNILSIGQQTLINRRPT